MIITLQPASRTDHITDDGQELTQKPYPFQVDRSGRVLPGCIYQRQARHVIGFAHDSARDVIDLLWAAVPDDPQTAAGMYVVTENHAGQWATWEIAIETVTVSEEN